MYALRNRFRWTGKSGKGKIRTDAETGPYSINGFYCIWIAVVGYMGLVRYARTRPIDLFWMQRKLLFH